MEATATPDGTEEPSVGEQAGEDWLKRISNKSKSACGVSCSSVAAFGHDGAIGEGIVLGNAIKKSVRSRTGVPDHCNSLVSTRIGTNESLAFAS